MKVRLFLTCWIVFSLHFATNVVREHYPAFTLIDQGDFVCDRYAGFHSDIFKHTDGHWYIGNNVMGSVIAAVPLALFDPLLDHLEERSRAGLEDRAPEEDYETRYPNRAKFFRLVRRQGLDLRFGASTAITSAFLMAPLAALMVVFLFGVLVRRGVDETRSLWLAILFAFGSPLFYRAGFLNHNVFLMAVVLGSFLCVWSQDGASPSYRRRFWGGFLGGMALALDYAGVIPLLAVFGYLLLTERPRTGGWRGAIGSGMAFVIGSVPPVLFLWGSQYGMYGHPFMPGQVWMRDVNYTDRGWRGFGAPDLEVFMENLFSLDYGMYAFAPFLLLGLIPAVGGAARVLPRAERRFTAAFLAAFLVFCAANQYSRMQWNTGFRYLLPLVPFVFLQASDHLRRLPIRVLAPVTVLSVLHGWVLSMHRYTPPDRLRPDDADPSTLEGSWRLFIENGVDFPWLQVLRSTPSIRFPGMDAWWFPVLLLTVTAIPIFFIWRWPRRRSELR